MLDRLVREGRATAPAGPPNTLPPPVRMADGITLSDIIIVERGRKPLWPGLGPEPGSDDDPV